MQRREFIKAGAAAVAMPAILKAAAAPSVESAAGDKVRIVRVVYGDFDLAESWVVPGGSPQKRCPIVLGFHLLEFDGRRVLVDVGCDHFEMEGRQARNFIRPAEALRRLGVAPETIEACLISHSHGGDRRRRSLFAAQSGAASAHANQLQCRRKPRLCRDLLRSARPRLSLPRLTGRTPLKLAS